MIFNTTAAEIIDRSLKPDTHSVLLEAGALRGFGDRSGYPLYRWGYQAILRRSLLGLILATILLPSFSLSPDLWPNDRTGARRWIGVFGLTFSTLRMRQIPHPLLRDPCRRHAGNAFSKSFSFLLLLKLAVPLGLILIEPDNGTVAILFATLVILFILMQVRWTFWALPLAALVPYWRGVASQMPHVAERLRVYLHPESDFWAKDTSPTRRRSPPAPAVFLAKG